MLVGMQNTPQKTRSSRRPPRYLGMCLLFSVPKERGPTSHTPPSLPHLHTSSVVYATGDGSLSLDAPIRFFPINMNAPNCHGSQHNGNASAHLASVSDSTM